MSLLSVLAHFHRSYFIPDVSPKTNVHFICGLVRLTNDIMHLSLQDSLLCKSSWAFPKETLSEVLIGSKGKREG